MKVPSFLLKRLYVTGSLRNTDDGWAFTLRNSIAAGEATDLEPLTLDGQALPGEKCFFHHGGEPVPFTTVDEDHPFGLESGKDITISVVGDQLEPGGHTVAMAFQVPVVGRLAFDFSDEVA